jgi:hypothetical protein
VSRGLATGAQADALAAARWRPQRSMSTPTRSRQVIESAQQTKISGAVWQAPSPCVPYAASCAANKAVTVAPDRRDAQADEKLITMQRDGGLNVRNGRKMPLSPVVLA